jgi:hypothetical protein
MNSFLETLKSRMSEAQARLQEAERKLGAAQREHDGAKIEYLGWQNAVEIESRKGGTLQVGTPANFALTPKPTVEAQDAEGQGANKTELIHNVIRQSPAGVSPAEIWRAVKNQITHRPYVYSVLKRLKDKNKVGVRRNGKYYPLTTTEEKEGHANTVVN